MKLTLIKPTIGRMTHSLYVDEARMEPLNLGVLAALTPEDVDVVHVRRPHGADPLSRSDRPGRRSRSRPIPRGAPTRSPTNTARRGVPVIMGGFQPTFAPEECAQHTDSLFIGDAESLWAR